MNLLDTIRIAILDLALHKFRSFLAALGIIVGVGSVIAVFSISDGQKQKALARFDTLGVRNVFAVSVKPPESGKKKSEENKVLAYGLLRKDLEHFKKFAPLSRYIVGVRDMRAKLYSSSARLLDLQVMATEPDYVRITDSRITRGRFISDMDQQFYNQVCVVGQDAGRKLFGSDDPMGRFVRVERAWYRVVGIVENRAGLKTLGGQEVNNCVFVPLETARVRHGDITVVGSQAVRIELDSIMVQVESQEAVPGVAARLERYLEKQHKDLAAKEDYALNIPLDKMRQKAAEQEDYTLLVVSIAGISMLVGGIGIMNIMLANVSDRRKEIGTRRALGARKRDILLQFVIEATTLTSLGGMAGLLVGYGIARVFGAWAQTPITPDSQYAVRAMLGSCLVGVLFRFWPAYQAARVNPIEALRSE